MYFFFKVVQYLVTKKVKGPIKKPIINYYLVKITNIIDRLFAIVEEEYDIQDNLKLVLVLKSLLIEFDQQKVYTVANPNITLKETKTSLASNEVQIFRDYATGLEIESTVMIAKIK